MSRASTHASNGKTGLSRSLAQLFERNSVLILGMAFEAGMLLGRRTNIRLTAGKVRQGFSSFADQVVTLAPSSVTRLVPDLLPAKTRRAPRRKSPAKKR